MGMVAEGWVDGTFSALVGPGPVVVMWVWWGVSSALCEL